MRLDAARDPRPGAPHAFPDSPSVSLNAWETHSPRPLARAPAAASGASSSTCAGLSFPRLSAWGAGKPPHVIGTVGGACPGLGRPILTAAPPNPRASQLGLGGTLAGCGLNALAPRSPRGEGFTLG